VHRHRDPDCRHQFVDARTHRPVLPFVNVLALPGTSAAMTRGRRYRCAACDRIIDLTVRAKLALPEAPIDTRTVDPFGDWLQTLESPEPFEHEPVPVKRRVEIRASL
jgi:hypothetical protein